MRRVRLRRPARVGLTALALVLVAPALAAAEGSPSRGEPAGLSAAPAGTTAAQVAPTWTPQPTTVLGGDDARPNDVAVSPNGRWALVVMEDRLRRLDITTRPSPVVGTATNVFGSDVAIAADGRTAYVANDRVLSVVDVSKPRPRLVRQVRNVTPQGVLSMERLGKRLFLSHGSGFPDSISDGVRVLSLAKARSPRAAGSFRSDNLPSGLAVTADGKKAITANALTGSVTIADVGGRKPRVQRRVLDLAFTPGSVTTVGRTAYALSDDDTRIAVISLKRNRLVKVREVRAGADGGSDISASPDGRYLHVAIDTQTDEPSIAVVSRRTLQPVALFSGLDFPAAVATSTKGPTKGSFFVVFPGSIIFDQPSLFSEVSRAG